MHVLAISMMYYRQGGRKKNQARKQGPAIRMKSLAEVTLDD